LTTFTEEKHLTPIIETDGAEQLKVPPNSAGTNIGSLYRSGVMVWIKIMYE
jgi:hypothetical protein